MLHRNRGIVAGKQFIAAESLQALYRPQPGTKRAGYGLGFNIEHTDATGVGDRLRHGGASGTLALLDLRQDLIVVSFTQVPTKQAQAFSDRLMRAINSVFPSR
jgi:CubicO group peptidase (beta-lactamase class C family)